MSAAGDAGAVALSGAQRRAFNLNTFLIGAVFVTSSFDIFLTVRVSGFSLRFCYLAVLALLALNAPSLHRLALRKPLVLGALPLAVWTLFLILFIPNTPYLARSIGYMGWHLIHLLFILFLVQGIGKRETFEALYRVYIASFFVVAAFGLVQFFLGIAGVKILITQMWMPRLPRINGFSYEPSYFGSYLIIGWIQMFFLSFRNLGLFRTSTIRIFLAVTTLCLVLSSSRMSILTALFFISALGVNEVLKLLVRFRISPGWIAILAALVLAVTGAAAAVVAYWDVLKFLFAGLGIAGGSTHSSGARLDVLKDTFAVFLRSPVLGVSLGGVAPGIAEIHGVVVHSNEAAKAWEGMGMPVEILAASGVFGFPFFLAYLYSLFAKPAGLIRKLRQADPALAFLLASMLFALFFELLILSMNQNILRPFLWVHIGMLSLAYKIGTGSPSRSTTPEGAVR